jgi:hypothetical protein
MAVRTVGSDTDTNKVVLHADGALSAMGVALTAPWKKHDLAEKDILVWAVILYGLIGVLIGMIIQSRRNQPDRLGLAG